MKKNIDKFTDEYIRELMHANADSAPVNPWFVRKVMNRLPDKPFGRKKSAAEIICYILGIIALIGAWAYSVNITVTDGLTVYTIATSGILTFLTLFCIGVFALPVVKRGL